MRVLGIDPGSRLTGWGVVETRALAFRHVASGTIALSPDEALPIRLAQLHAECRRLVADWAPAAVVLERAFVARNVQSAFRLGAGPLCWRGRLWRWPVVPAAPWGPGSWGAGSR